MGRYLLNSLLIASLATAISVSFNLMAGYAFAKLRFRGRDALFRLLLGALVIPGQVAMLPLFLMLKPLGLVDTYGGAIVPAMASVFGIFLVRQFARGIPDELLEAARIDGAGELRIFATVVVPLLKPIIATLAVFSFLGSWNDFMWPLIVLTDDSLHTLPGRAGRPVARARPGQRADDGRLGGDGAAGAAALPRAAAPLHGGADRRQREGMKARAARARRSAAGAGVEAPAAEDQAARRLRRSAAWKLSATDDVKARAAPGRRTARRARCASTSTSARSRAT